MTQQAINSIQLYKGNNPGTVEKALKMQKKSIVDELKQHFNASNLSDLAIKLSIG